jgi:ubiquinone/menaquinone biosynthesis C-methylase UbiE
MNVEQAYDIWSSIYDTNDNKTRDTEAFALRKILKNKSFGNCLEIGCGTGKNTQFLITVSDRITAVDLSEKMLEKAKEKIVSEKVEFIQADITKEWKFVYEKYDLITFSLVLEHIENLDFIFKQIANITAKNAYVYIGELHPFKQYSGTKARFEITNGTQIVSCFNHNISDFVKPALKFGFDLIDLDEYFDNEDRTKIPRIITVFLKKK